jgi:hypothetical protein
LTLQPKTEEKEQVGLTSDEVTEIRRLADDDVFFFGTVICGHKDLVYEDHAPLMYAAAGQADKLLQVLRTEISSEVVRDIRRECARLGIDPDADDALDKLRENLTVVDERIYRGSGKSSAITHTVRTWRMTKEPNLTACLITNTDPKAIDFCRQIRATILSTLYQVVYPDRVPDDTKGDLKENSIRLKGRTVPDKEPCLMVFGYKASPTGYHFDELHFDDLVGRENRSISELTLVRDFLANVPALYNPGIRFPIRRIHVGTRWDEEDDAARVRAYPYCFSVNVPIWRRDQPADDLRIPGTPTTQWYPLDKIRKRQEEILSDPEEGPMSWRCNYELDPTLAGGRIFPSDMVDRQNWTSYKDAKKTNGKEWVRRPAFDKDGKYIPILDALNKPVMVGNEALIKHYAFDPEQLYKVIACDQSFSDSGDEWAVACEGMDQYNHRYVLEVRKGHGVEAMLDALLMMVIEWKPRRAGMEKIAAQHVIELVLKLGDKYRRLRPLIEPIAHNNLAKEYRIRNFVAEVLKMRRLWLNPKDPETKQEMTKYKPGKTAKDNVLDALAMCEVLIQKSMQPKEGEESYKKKFEAINNRNAQRMRAYGMR